MKAELEQKEKSDLLKKLIKRLEEFDENIKNDRVYTKEDLDF